MQAQQLPFDFDSHQREARAWLISAMEITGATEKERAVVDLVYRITHQNGGVLAWTLARIGGEFRRDRQTIRRWINAAAAKGLLTVDEQRRLAGGQRPHALSIDWESVRRIACQRGNAKAINRGINVCAEPEYQNNLPGYQNHPPGYQVDTPIRNNCALTPQLKPPPTPMPEATPSTTSWEGVGEMLLQLGMARGRKVAAELAGSPMQPEDALAIVAAWRAAGGGTPAAAWGVGALCHRLAAWQPGQDANDASLWPPASEAYQQHEARRQAAIERDRAIAAQLLSRAKYAEERRVAIASRKESP